jgi:hypothetical protein
MIGRPFLKLLENGSEFEVYIQISLNNILQLYMVIIYDITRRSVVYLCIFEKGEFLGLSLGWRRIAS